MESRTLEIWEFGGDLDAGRITTQEVPAGYRTGMPIIITTDRCMAVLLPAPQDVPRYSHFDGKLLTVVFQDDGGMVTDVLDAGSINSIARLERPGSGFPQDVAVFMTGRYQGDNASDYPVERFVTVRLTSACQLEVASFDAEPGYAVNVAMPLTLDGGVARVLLEPLLGWVVGGGIVELREDGGAHGICSAVVPSDTWMQIGQPALTYTGAGFGYTTVFDVDHDGKLDVVSDSVVRLWRSR